MSLTSVHANSPMGIAPSIGWMGWPARANLLLTGCLLRPLAVRAKASPADAAQTPQARLRHGAGISTRGMGATDPRRLRGGPLRPGLALPCGARWAPTECAIRALRE